jgi:PAS domain S-box-containing protein
MTADLRVLIVDDNPADRALATRELAGEFPDIRAIEVADATTFETAVERGSFELVITEFRLAWSDGLSVFRELKYRYPEIPVIMFTGAGSEEIAVEAMRAGLDDYVLKSPDHVVRLPVVVAAALERAGERQARRRAEESLRSSEAHLRALFASMSDAIFVLDRDGRYLEIAPTRPELLYRPADEVLGKTVHEIFAPEQADHFLEAIRRALDTRSTVEVEYMLGIRGTDMWFAASISPMLEDSVVWVARDVTERKRAEAALHESEERFRVALENSPVVVFNQDKELRYTWVYNPHPGLVAETALGKTDAELLPAEDAARLAEIKRRVLDTGVAAREEVRTIIGGQAFFYDLTVEPLRDVTGNIIGVTCASADITERKQAEEALRQSERRYDTFINATDDLAFLKDDQLRYRIVNTANAEFLGRPVEDIIGRTDQELMPPEAAEACRRSDLLTLAQQGVVVTEEQVGGRVYELHKFPVLLEGSRPGVGGWARDITDRRKAEEALRESEELFRTSFENATTGVALVGTDGRFLRANPRLCELLGYTEEELQQVTFNDVTHSEDKEIGAAFLVAALSGETSSASYEKRYVHKDGHVVWIHASTALVRDAAGEPRFFIGHLRDITERKRAEEALRRSEGRIRELLGHLFRAQEEERARIAGDIHDDSIQVMTAVGLRLDTLQRRLTDPEALESLQPLGETVTSAIARLRHLMFELRPRVLDEDGLALALRVYLDHMSEQVQIEYTLSNSLEEEPALTVRTVLYRIAQEALVNIRKHANAAHVDVVLEPREAGYAVKITDDGSGFEVSTEPALPGHLGLAAMRERAEMVGGWCWIESTPGEGTTVEFWVPAEVD